MARINYKVDKELADQGLLRISVVAKALHVAPKTVNAWTKYTTNTIGGVKYLPWHEIINDKQTERDTFGLSSIAKDVYSVVTSVSAQKAQPVVVSKTNDAIAKAKALLMPKKLELIKEWPVVSTHEVPTTQVKIETIPDEILSRVKPEENSELLTIHPDYEHLLKRKRK